MTTQYANASYQEIIDLHTETDRVSVIGIHTPVTRTPYDMLKGFFDTFQKYHYDGCSLTLVPAARLPADPSQVSYGAGEPPIDPRDMLNPILWHGCHGESLGSVLNQFYSGRGSTTDISRMMGASIEQNNASTSQIGNEAIYESLYYQALTDNTWLKAHPQRGFRKKGLRPLVYALSTDRQFTPGLYGSYSPYEVRASATARAPSDNAGLSPVLSGTLGTNGTDNNFLNVQPSQGLQFTYTSSGNIGTNTTTQDTNFFTSKLCGLGWLDTRSRALSGNITTTGFDGTSTNDSTLLESHYANIEARQEINYLPRLFMGICLLPPAYKTEQYFRIILNHRFSFKKFRGMSMDGDYRGNVGYGSTPNYYNFN